MTAVMFHDLHTKFVGVHLVLTHGTADTHRSLQHFPGDSVIKHVHSDRAGELMAACRLLGIPHDCTERGDAQADGVAERRVGEIEGAAVAALQQSGIPHQFWNEAVAHAAVALNTRRTGRYGHSA